MAAQMTFSIGSEVFIAGRVLGVYGSKSLVSIDGSPRNVLIDNEVLEAKEQP